MKLFDMIVAALVVCGLIFISDLAWSHEGHGFTHLTGTSPSLIGQRNCGSITVWFADENDDGEVDQCYGVFVDHDKFHIKPFPTSIVRDWNGEYKLSCTCETLYKPENSLGI